MEYQFEFVVDEEKKVERLYVWMVNSNVDKRLVFRVAVGCFGMEDNCECIRMYHMIKSGDWQNKNFHIYIGYMGPYYHIDTVNNDGKKFITISEYCNIFDKDKKSDSFKLILAYDQCNIESFLEFLRQLIIHNVPDLPYITYLKTRDYQDEHAISMSKAYDEYINVCKEYNMYIPINKNIVEQWTKN